MIGVCFGHQIIAKALGGKVVKSPEGWAVGMSQNSVLQHKSWMQPLQSSFNILVSYQDQVLELPKEAELIASNSFCPHFMFQVGTHFLTLQGHPEFSKAYSEALMNYRRPILGEDVYQKGIQSLALGENNNTLAQWIINFLCA